MSDLAVATEETPLMSFSQLNLWDRCRFAWHLSYEQGWTRVEKKRSLEFGGFVHELLAMHYSGKSVEEIETFVRNFFLDTENVTGQSIQIIDQATWLYEQYRDWSQYADRGQNTLAVEYHFEIDYRTAKGRPFRLQGYIDHVYEEDNKVWLQDHKTHNASPISPVEAMMDPQMPVYAIALREHGFTPFGIEFNQLNSYPYKRREEVTPDKLFKRERTYRADQELNAILEEVKNAVDDLIDNRTNIRRSLKRECRMCDFQDPCLMNLKGFPLEDVFAAGEWRKKESFQ